MHTAPYFAKTSYFDRTFNKPAVKILPGEYHATDSDTMIVTVLGSCVSVCIRDRINGIGGMNHYMLPLWNGDGLPTPKYGNVAIEKLIEKMVSFGCRKEQLVAKCFGGANVLGDMSGPMQIGERNIVLAEEILATHRIPIVAREMGGFRGMKIIFNTRTGIVQAGRLAGSPVAANPKRA